MIMIQAIRLNSEEVAILKTVHKLFVFSEGLFKLTQDGELLIAREAREHNNEVSVAYIYEVKRIDSDFFAEKL